jgi:hypothetical protein
VVCNDTPHGVINQTATGTMTIKAMVIAEEIVDFRAVKWGWSRINWLADLDSNQ